jgi:hypothetical protein
MLRAGAVDAPANGDVAIIAVYAGHRAHIAVRLMRNHPGQVLATVQGRVYTDAHGLLQTLAHVHVELVDGLRTALSTTTADDGSYTLVGVAPGTTIAVRAAKAGFLEATASITIRPGDNSLNLLLETPPPSAGSTI